MKGSEAAEGEGAAKMASASSGPSAVGFSSADSGAPACPLPSGNQGGGRAGERDLRGGTCSWGCPGRRWRGGQTAGFQAAGLSVRAGESEERMDLAERGKVANVCQKHWPSSRRPG